MLYLDSYLKKIVARGNEKLAVAIKKTAETIGTEHIKNLSFNSHNIGLLFGNVQSGKTAQMFGVICKAADLGISVFIILTTDNVVLQQQTLERVQSDLDGFCICGETDQRLFLDNCLIKPAIIVLKKNSRVLKLWSNVLNSVDFMKGNPLFIIDDEADAASLNTLINKEQQSSINKYLDIIRNASLCSIYLQVTGTPQALFLQTLASGWRPNFVNYFEPGETYLGGDFFFPGSRPGACVVFTDGMDAPVRSAIIHHLLVSAQLFLSGASVSNCLVHPSVKQSVHDEFKVEIERTLAWCKDHFDDVLQVLREQYDVIAPTKHSKQPFEAILGVVREMLDSYSVNIIVMNAKNEVATDSYTSGCNIIVGGNSLGRGVTFPALHTIFYTRSSKRPQADTMWQHSRMFGYDRDPGMMAVYIDEYLYKLFADINATNKSIISQVQHSLEVPLVYYCKGLMPTRKNVVKANKLNIISGGTNYYPYDPDNINTHDLDALLSGFSDNVEYYQVSAKLIKELLAYVVPSSDFDLEAFVSTIDAMLASAPAQQAVLIVRRNRGVTQGTGALLSANDWKLGERFQDKIVLTMYNVTGNGWKRSSLWVPNIKLPGNAIFYSIKD